MKEKTRFYSIWTSSKIKTKLYCWDLDFKNKIDDFDEWKPLKKWYPENTLLYDWNMKYDTLLDFDDWVWAPTASENFKNILENQLQINNKIKQVEFFPVRITDSQTRTKDIEWYYVMNILKHFYSKDNKNYFNEIIDTKKSIDI